jgi:hypothetical protein
VFRNPVSGVTKCTRILGPDKVLQIDTGIELRISLNCAFSCLATEKHVVKI